jgi:DUF2075 family protein
MRLYEGDVRQFRSDVINNRIADIMATKYQEYFHRTVGRSEYRSWENSLNFLKNAIDYSDLTENKMILEYKLPNNNSRIDALLFGRHAEIDSIVIIELKQWSNDGVFDSSIDGNVEVEINGRRIQVAHPSFQVEGYYYGLIDNLTVFEERPEIKLYPAAYCHNYSRIKDRVLYQDKFRAVIEKYPLFAKEDLEALGAYLKDRLSDDAGITIFTRFINSNVRPTKNLMKHVGEMFDKQQVFNLIDEQIPARNAILSKAKALAQSKEKSVIIIKGGPGTGKSVIALETMVELLKQGKNVYYATGSSAFTRNLRSIFGKRAKDRFKYFFSFTHHKENEIDVLICDEAHRLRKNSADYGVPVKLRSERAQIEDLIMPARLSIFFIDEHQVVRPNEIGDVALIKKTAEKFNTSILEFELKTQFRAGGSEIYLQWLENTLDITPSDIWLLGKDEPMEFKIFDSPEALRDAIRQKNMTNPNTARIVAGFCWKWSKPKADGTLVNDVKIGNFEMPWENKKEAWKWATHISGMDQVGTVYTSQGFEFDYIGVLFGRDLIYDAKSEEWVGHPENSFDIVTKRDKASFTAHLKNVYRVLMSRAHKGVYVYFMDKDTERFFKSRIEYYKDK